MIALLHFEDAPDLEQRAEFEQHAKEALEVLAQRPGFVRGTLGRSTDDDAWVLLTEWQNVGSYRRALGAYEVKLYATPLMATALGMPSAFEALLDVAPGGAAVVTASDREP